VPISSYKPTVMCTSVGYEPENHSLALRAAASPFLGCYCCFVARCVCSVGENTNQDQGRNFQLTRSLHLLFTHHAVAIFRNASDHRWHVQRHSWTHGRNSLPILRGTFRLVSVPLYALSLIDTRSIVWDLALFLAY
jgi:hypothetical protein